MTIYTLDDRVAMRETIKQLRSTISLVEAIAGGQQKAASATHKFLLEFTGQSELSGQHAALTHFLKAQDTSNKSKEMRMDGVTPFMRAQRFFVPKNAPWLATFLAEVLKFPSVKHDDQADMLSQALAFVQDGAFAHLGSKKLKGTY
ncbi:MAG: hypothetical protein ABS76_26635 [Pelagibacterium sp. SCN 64-44]|nr:MAG: hypothetical protein ABS76_26635 [Pelagibacterium sp. SCN 64-44]